MKRLLLLAAAFILLLALPPIVGSNCGESLDTHCTSCHYKTRICYKIGKKSKRGWKITVKRMLRYGLELTRAEQEDIVECLTELEEGSKLVCE